MVEEPVAKLQFGPKSALAAPDSDFLQIAYTHSYMFDLQKTEPALRSSNLGRKASFAIGSEDYQKNRPNPEALDFLVSSGLSSGC